MACISCGHAEEEHGGDPKYPGSTGCQVCKCDIYEAEEDDDFKPPILRLGKLSNGGIGGGGGKNPKKMKSTNRKQRKRTVSLKDKLQVHLSLQLAKYGRNFCVCCGKYKPPFVLDHVNTRNQSDADRNENLQIMNQQDNIQKGSVRKDYRDAWFTKLLALMDDKEKDESSNAG